MAEDATLDAFATDDADERDDEADATETAADSEPGRDAEVDEPEPGDDHEADDPEPPTLTYTSSPEGDECADCGATVQRRWRAGEGAEDPDALVCPECKVW